MIHPRRNIPLLAFCLALGGCVSQEVRTVDMTPPQQSTRALEETQLLDIGVSIFDSNVPEDYDEQVESMIHPEVRRAESNYMAYVAKNLLQSTGNWGAVRVVPRPSDAVDVTVSGQIVESNGERMTVNLKVSDATGATWFQKDYHALASKYAYDESLPPDIDPFQAVYKNLADDMLAYRETMTDEQIAVIRATAEMKFARGFSPDAFDTHVSEDENGSYTLKRLPAEDDPMLARVRKIREREYLFIDTLDEYYAEFQRNMYPAYQSWRSATYSEAIAYRQLQSQARARAIGGTMAIVGGIGGIYGSDNAYVDASGLVSIGGGVALIKSAVNKRNEAVMHAEVIREVGTAAEAELIPFTMDLENQSIRLQGSVDEQYNQLRQILRRVYYEDLGLEVPPVNESAQSTGTSTSDAETADSEAERASG